MLSKDEKKRVSHVMRRKILDLKAGKRIVLTISSRSHHNHTKSRLISAAAGWPAVYFLLSLICIPANALHFYMQGGQPKCFFEELPKDTLTVGKTPPTARSPRLTLPKGHYEVQQYNADAKEFQPDSSVGLYITVDQVFDNDHRIVQQKGESKGRFTFTAGGVRRAQALLLADQLQASTRRDTSRTARRSAACASRWTWSSGPRATSRARITARFRIWLARCASCKGGCRTSGGSRCSSG